MAANLRERLLSIPNHVECNKKQLNYFSQEVKAIYRYERKDVVESNNHLCSEGTWN